MSNMQSGSQHIWHGQEKHQVFQIKLSEEILIVFPEQGEEIACDFVNFPTMNSGELYKKALRNSTL